MVPRDGQEDHPTDRTATTRNKLVFSVKLSNHEGKYIIYILNFSMGAICESLKIQFLMSQRTGLVFFPK